MKIRVIETGEVKELSLIDKDGHDWMPGYIHHLGGFRPDGVIHNEATGEYSAPEEVFTHFENVWAEYMEEYREDEEGTKIIIEEIGKEEYQARINSGVDYFTPDDPTEIFFEAMARAFLIKIYTTLGLAPGDNHKPPLN